MESRSSTKLFTTSHIPAYTLVHSSEDAGGKGANDASLPLSNSPPNAIWFFGAGTSHRARVVSLPTSALFNSRTSTLGAILRCLGVYSKRSPQCRHPTTSRTSELHVVWRVWEENRTPLAWVARVHNRDNRGFGSLPPEPGYLFSYRDNVRESSFQRSPCATEETIGRVTAVYRWERNRNCPGSMWTHNSQTLHDCIGCWARPASYDFFRGDRGTGTPWCVPFGDAQRAETTLTRFTDEDPSQTRQANEPLPAVLLPPLPALTTLKIGLCSGGPFPHLADILSSIHLAPALTSITFTFDRWWYGEYFPSSDPWAEVDKWLARMACRLRSREV